MVNELGMINGPDNLNRKGSDQRPVKVEGSARHSASSTSAEGVGESVDRVSLSPEAEAIIEAKQSGAARQDAHRDLDTIKREIAEGRYQIDSRQIAEKLIQHETLLRDLES